eukprot:GDKJ01018549.1.p1 GENE.GDKJ01018549.1~~GDKJ01018549.1.p1  ORF type:complete len:456 (-),score=91.23 GDKJ01018549.1:52-1398(-)
MSNVHDILGVQKKVTTVSLTGSKPKAKSKRKSGVPRALAALGEFNPELVHDFEKESKKEAAKKKEKPEIKALKNKYERVLLEVSRKVNAFMPMHWKVVGEKDEYVLFNLEKKKNRSLIREIIRPTLDEYNRLVTKMDPFWTFEKYHFFINLVERFRGYFIAIHDSLPHDMRRHLNTVELVKDFYFSTSANILRVRGVKTHHIVSKGFNIESEVTRRRAAEHDFSMAMQMAKEETALKLKLQQAKARRDAIEEELKNAKKSLGISANVNMTAALERKKRQRILSGVGTSGFPSIVPNSDAIIRQFGDYSSVLKKTSRQIQIAHRAADELCNVNDCTSDLSDMVKATLQKFGLSENGPILQTHGAVNAYNQLIAAIIVLGCEKVKYHNNVFKALDDDRIGEKIEPFVIPVSEITESMPGVVKLTSAKPKAKGRAPGKRVSKKDADPDFEE